MDGSPVMASVNAPAMILAADFRAIGLTIAVLVLLGFVAAFFRNVAKAKSELGSEIELAANKKPYLSDEELEGTKLDRSLSFALIVLGLTSIALPFYWLAEPGRQEGAIDAYQINFESRGEGTYVEGAQCVNCHAAGGVGGAAAYVLQDEDGQFISNASWMAPALDDVLLRYSEEEVTYVLNFGRPGSPMAAWGVPGGGPLTAYQVQNVIEYIDTYTKQSLDPIDIAAAGSDDPNDAESLAAQEAANGLAVDIRDEIQRSLDDGEFSTVGEAVFNLGYFSGFSAGSLSCGRCHTAGWSLGPDVPHPAGDPLAEGVAGCGGGYPSGIGFSLCGGIESRFPNDTWKLPDGTWAPPGGLADDDGFYFLANDGSRVPVDEKSVPVRADGTVYEILEGGEEDGDLADCRFVSDLWEPEGVTAEKYAFLPNTDLVPDDSADGFVNPDELTFEDAQDMSTEGEAVVFGDKRIGVDCTIIDMPERTSRAQYDFIYNGANAGEGYGRGGLSAAGMMPGFGKSLPPEFIQAVVDYERGLSQ